MLDNLSAWVYPHSHDTYIQKEDTMTRAPEGDGKPAESDSVPSRRSRRQAIALAGVAAAAATVAALGTDRGQKAHAASGDPLIIGQGNQANPGDSTLLEGDLDAAAFQVNNNNPATTAIGVAGRSDSGMGVWGESMTSVGVAGRSDSGPAVEGVSGGVGVRGTSGSGFGVAGASDSGTGVAAHSNTGIGVEARGSSGVGVHGDTFDGIGVRAQCLGAAVPGHPTGPELALDVIGKARFSTAGSGSVPAWAAAAPVLNPAVTAASHITVTFTEDPGRALVSWVQRVPGIGFRVHLSSRLHREAHFTYLIVEPGV